MKYELREDQDGRCGLYRVEEDGTETLLGSDRGEPEDNSFHRDWAWVPAELNQLAVTVGILERQLALIRESVGYRAIEQVNLERYKARAALEKIADLDIDDRTEFAHRIAREALGK